MINRRDVTPVKRLGHFGSIIFGCVLFLFGWLAKKWVVDAGLVGGDDAVVLWRVTIGVMVVGALIVISNIAWIAFALYMAHRD